ncbi:large subunit ribosomal protein L18Ae [Nematocida sp. LUAm3]|nr:large subunit ribosomal protein L18Ae [Nematocida sp. LUAm3]KAI5174673.1 large subunit ribosomal protein L18Ae [Nematocida sp. LUAm2]KAI5177917.1 large subunit ribosomal protein L18Ae [Nematocida sp. LUAm1]
MHIKEYRVLASEKPTEKNASPQVYECNIFAINEIVARSRTFSLLNQKYKIKLSGGVVLKIEEVPQYSDVKVRTFGVHAVYKVKTSLAHVHKEIRALTRAAAVFKLQQELRSRHSATPECVSVIDVKEIKDQDITSKDVLQTISSPQYPLFDKRVPATTPSFIPAAVDRA